MLSDQINEGDNSYSEAMKTQNEIQAPISGTITSIQCEEGQSIEANVPLVIIQPDEDDKIKMSRESTPVIISVMVSMEIVSRLSPRRYLYRTGKGILISRGLSDILYYLHCVIHHGATHDRRLV